MRHRPTQRVTIETVAARANVSAATVSFVVNGRGGVAPGTRERVQQAIAELGWAPSSSARALARQRSSAIGLVLRRSPLLLGADPFFGRFLGGVESVLAAHEYALVLRVVGEDDEAEARSYRWLGAQGRVDGFLLLDLRDSDPRFALLDELGLPAVAVGEPARPSRHPWLAIDDRAAMQAATSHLVALGHRRIGHVSGPRGYVHSRSRRQAWSQTVAAAGLEPGPEVPGDFTAEGGAAATKRLLSSDRPHPTAIVYANDLMALAGVRMLREAGLRVPDDVSVTGFDDVALAAHSQPALTTARQDTEGWGAAAAASLLATLQAEPGRTGWLQPAELVIRASTVPPSDRQDLP